MDQYNTAATIIESLRRGVPPQRGVECYSVGHEKLINGIRRFHLSGIGERGIIRFISGSWGAGKTHFFRLLREAAFADDCVVSNVELNVNEAPLNKFERVFYAIVRNVQTPTSFHTGINSESAPFGRVLQESLAFLGSGTRTIPDEVPYEQYAKACDALLTDTGMDIDFKKMIQHYWETFLSEGAEAASRERTRGEILAWFSGEGSAGSYRKHFGINKMVTKENAKLMLQSLARFVRLAGYRGLLILFDEAEQAYSIMRKSALKDAHNNLLSLINNIESLPGLFLVYATTQDFFTDPRHGIVIYGALAGRIGTPEERSPRALDSVWNFDAVTTDLDDYQAAARKIRDLYQSAYKLSPEELPSNTDIDDRVADLFMYHPALSAVRFWRVLMKALIADFDDHLEGDVRPVVELYDDVLDRLRED